MRYVFPLVVALYWPATASAQYFNWGNAELVNCRLSGQVVDYSHSLCKDSRIFSPILGRPRDLYVYLPPGYNAHQAYSLLIYLHPGSMDERSIVAAKWLVEMDQMIACGQMPPVILVCPDGLYGGDNLWRDPHSLFVNGCGGQFEDFLVNELVPFMTTHYSVRPEREAHAIVGVSAGGYGGMGLALKHRDLFGAVATMSAPLNLRYTTVSGNYRNDFDPCAFRMNECYDPDMVIGAFYCGLEKVRARKFIEPVYGCSCDVVTHIKADNPADLLTTTDLRPGELAMHVDYGGRDNYNFDAQGASFVFLASQRGVCVEVDVDPSGKHDLFYLRPAHQRAFAWLGQHVLPPLHVGCNHAAQDPAKPGAPMPSPMPAPEPIQSVPNPGELRSEPTADAPVPPLSPALDAAKPGNLPPLPAGGDLQAVPNPSELPDTKKP